MSDEIQVKTARVRLVKGDITDLEIESFVFYAQHNLQLGSGYGNAISMRGGPSVQEELKQHGELKTTEVITTEAGEMKAGHIIHAVGPRFQEPELENKLRTTVENCLKEADNKGFKALAFPAMGTGFYGVPLETSAAVTLDTITKYLSNGNSHLQDVVVCLLDNREYKPFAAKLSTMKNA